MSYVLNAVASAASYLVIAQMEPGSLGVAVVTAVAVGCGYAVGLFAGVQR